MKTVLFVDDELIILDLYAEYFAMRRAEWTVHTCDDPRKVRAFLEKFPIDIIVCDFKMPGMNGATVLDTVRNSHPGIIRIIISGGAHDVEQLFAARIAHRSLKKPLPMAALLSELENVYLLYKSSLGCRVRTVINGIDFLPALPAAMGAVLRELGRGADSSMKEIARLIASDPGMSANVLKILSSKLVWDDVPILSVEHAVNMLGLNSIQSLVVNAKIIELFPLHPDNSALIDEILCSGALCSRIMRGIFCLEMQKGTAKAGDRDAAESIGMLHDVGRLILASLFSDSYRSILLTPCSTEAELTAREKKLFGVSHAEVGAYLLSLWGLPGHIPPVVALHAETKESREGDEILVRAIRWAVLASAYILAGDAPGLQGDPLLQSKPDWYGVVQQQLS